MSEEAIRSVCGPKLLVRDAWKSRDYRDVIIFDKLRFQNVFCPHENKKAGVFKFFQCEVRFRKASFW